MSDPNRTTVSLGPSGSDEAGTANPGQIADLPTHPAATPSQPRSEEQGQESAGDSGIVEAELAAQILPNAVTTACPFCGSLTQTSHITHPKSLTRDPDHIRNVQTFADDLMEAFRGGMPQPGYDNVRILMIRWEHDDLGAISEVKALETQFIKMGFVVGPHLIIPGETSADEYTAAKALRSGVEAFQQSVGKDDLLIVYYAGHGVLKADNMSYWAAHARQDSNGDFYTPQIPWHPHQYELENYISNDVAFMFDCCFAASAGTRSGHKGIKELLAASAKEAGANGVGPMSFTRRVIHALENNRNAPFTVSQLYSHILNAPLNLDFPNYAWTTSELRIWQRTPIYIPLSKSTRSITMTRRPSAGITQPEIAEVGQNSYLDSLRNGPFIVLALAIEESVIPSIEGWREWLLNRRPREVRALSAVKMLAGFPNQSSLLLVEVPLQLWLLLPERPAYKFVDIVTSTDELETLESGYKPESPDRAKLKSPKTQVADGKEASIEQFLKDYEELKRTALQIEQEATLVQGDIPGPEQDRTLLEEEAGNREGKQSLSQNSTIVDGTHKKFDATADPLNDLAAQVILSIRLGNGIGNQRPDTEIWTNWLKEMPSEARDIKIEGVYQPF